MQLPVQPAPSQELVVSSTLDDPSSVQHEDEIGVDDRGQPVGDDETRATRQCLGERPADQDLGLRVEVGGRLVE